MRERSKDRNLMCNFDSCDQPTTTMASSLSSSRRRRSNGSRTTLCCSSSSCFLLLKRWHNVVALPSSSSSSFPRVVLVPTWFVFWVTILLFRLASHDDPVGVASAATIYYSSSDDGETFSAGDGGLCWQDLIITTSPLLSDSSSSDNSRSSSSSTIVHKCSGYIPNGHVCGILGPSGSGKTSFLTALAGSSSSSSSSSSTATATTAARVITTGSSSSLYVHGNVCLYHQQQEDDVDNDDTSRSSSTSRLHVVGSSISKHDVAWLQQEDEFFSMLTVQETLQLAAFLELPHLSQRQRQERVQEQLATLGLTHVAHRRVGTSSSGGGGGDGDGGGGTVASSSTINDTAATSASPLRESSLEEKMDITDHDVDDNDDDLQIQTQNKRKRTTRTGTSTAATTGGRLSGGERRRLSIALELLTHDKKILLADESTSGLDSRMARQVMSLLQRMARLNNIPAICSLHQPQSYIYWNLLDDIIVMAPGGHVVYSGPRQDCLDYFAQHTKATTNGPHTCPQGTNPAEFLVDLVSIDTEDAEQAQRDLQRIQELAHCFAKYQKQHQQRKKHPFFTVKVQQDTRAKDNDIKAQSSTIMTFRKRRLLLAPLPRIAPLLGHLGLVSRRWLALLRRSWRQNIRNRKANLFRFVTSAGTAILLSMVFYPTIGGASTTSGLQLPTANSVADRVALLTFGAINMFFMAFLKTITLISEEQPVVQREQTRQQYSSLEYLMAKVVAELPLDTLFASVFTTVLKLCSGVRISWRLLTATFGLLTISGASLGFMLGSWFQGSREMSMASSSPVVVVLMVVGVINPGGVDAKSPPPPALVRWLKRCSPFVYAVEALCLGEYPGMQLRGPRDGLWGRLKDLPRMGAFAMVQNGDQVIEALGLKGKTYQGVMAILGKLSIYYLVLSWVGLQVMGHHSHWSPTGSTESCQSKGSDNAGNSNTDTRTNEDVLLMRNNDSSEMPALKVPPRGW